MGVRWRVIIDFDGTLTAEEEQAARLGARSLETLAEILSPADGRAPVAMRPFLEEAYATARRRVLADPARYGWVVAGHLVSYGDEGAFILNTTTIQTMLDDLLAAHPEYAEALEAALPHREYDLVADTSNYLFHRHTAEFPPLFRPEARDVLIALLARPDCEPVVLTNSLGDKVIRLLGALDLPQPLRVLGDTRQYEMDGRWTPPVDGGGREIWQWPADDLHPIDLRRPAYHRALTAAQKDGARVAVVADTLSLPGALPLAMGIPFLLLSTPYTPAWCRGAVNRHPYGRMLGRLGELPAALEALGGNTGPGD